VPLQERLSCYDDLVDGDKLLVQTPLVECVCVCPDICFHFVCLLDRNLNHTFFLFGFFFWWWCQSDQSVCVCVCYVMVSGL